MAHQEAGTKSVDRIEVHRDGFWDVLERGKVNCGIDVVAIHGVAARSAWTWTVKVAEGRYVNWLTDEYMLPSKLQTPRVLLYGYQSLWHSDPVVTHARTIAYRLLERLEEERAHCPKRPLLFIAHSYGGIVLIKAMIGARYKHENILQSTVGLCFFGTPFRGAEGSLINGEIREYWEKQGKTVNDAILQDVRPGSVVLEDTLQDFLDIGREVLPPIVCFYETKYTNVGLLGNGQEKKELMTTRISATLDIAQHNVELDRNHFDMNKFKGTDDIEYQKTVAFISKLCKEAQKVSANRRLKRLPPLRPPTSSTGGSSNNTSQMSRVQPATFDTSRWKEPTVLRLGSIIDERMEKLRTGSTNPFAANLSNDGQHALLLGRKNLLVFPIDSAKDSARQPCYQVNGRKGEDLQAACMTSGYIVILTWKVCYLVNVSHKKYLTPIQNPIRIDIGSCTTVPRRPNLRKSDFLQRMAVYEHIDHVLVAYGVENRETGATVQIFRLSPDGVGESQTPIQIPLEGQTVKMLNFSSEGSRLICATDKGKLLVWEIQTDTVQLQCEMTRPFSMEYRARGITSAKTWLMPQTRRPYILCTASPSTERLSHPDEISFLAPASTDLLDVRCEAFHSLAEIQKTNFHHIMDGTVANGGHALALVSREGHLCVVQLEAHPEGGLMTFADGVVVCGAKSKNKLRLHNLETEFEGAVRFSADDSRLIAVDKHGGLIIVDFAKVKDLPSISLRPPILPPLSFD